MKSSDDNRIKNLRLELAAERRRADRAAREVARLSGEALALRAEIKTLKELPPHLRGLDPVQRLSRDLREAAVTLTDTEARYLTDTYYMMQENRKRAKNQERALGSAETPEPHEVLTWVGDQSEVLEKQIQRALDAYTEAHMMGEWLRGVFGIGPTLAAGLLANIDIKRARTSGQIWAFAGLAADGQKPWLANELRPWNQSLRTLCWKIGDSFVKFSGDERCFYGHIYRERKEYEVRRNDSGGNKHRAKQRLERDRKRGRESKEAGYHKEGKLSPGHIDLQARRYAVKFFLAHLHDEWWRRATGTEPVEPFPMEFLGHAHKIEPPQAAQAPRRRGRGRPPKMAAE